MLIYNKVFDQASTSTLLCTKNSTSSSRDSEASGVSYAQ